MLLSVVIPAYNYGHLLRRAIESVLAQLTDERELVVVDDGSIDDTGKVLEAIQASSPRAFHWVRQDNAGAAAARNRGMRMSRGTFLLFLDADDELEEGALDALSATIGADPAATVVLGGRTICRPQSRDKYYPPCLRLSADPCQRLADYLLHKKIRMSHGAFAARRELFLERPYAERHRGSEDIPVFAYLVASGRLATVDAPLVRIHKHADSLRHSHELSEDRMLALVEDTFAKLPAACQHLRGSFLAKRYLGLFKKAQRKGANDLARKYFRKALAADKLRAIRPSHLVRAIWAYASGRF